MNCAIDLSSLRRLCDLGCVRFDRHFAVRLNCAVADVLVHVLLEHIMEAIVDGIDIWVLHT